MTEPNTVLFTLEGLTQSFSTSLPYSRRSTEVYPTLSMMMGMITNALGLTLTQADEWLEDHVPFIQMGVRLDCPGSPYVDYQTAGALKGLPRADGKGLKHTPNTNEPETYEMFKDYWIDARYVVVIQSTPLIVKEIADALANPKRVLFLGRKNCPPSVPFRPRVDFFPSLLEALTQTPWRKHGKDRRDRPTALMPGGKISEGSFYVHDVPLSFNYRRYGSRRVHEVEIEVIPIEVQVEKMGSRGGASEYLGWEERKATRLAYDQFSCVVCGRRGLGLTAHHINYKRLGHENIYTDLRTMCRPCHQAVTILEREDGRKGACTKIDPLDDLWIPRIRDIASLSPKERAKRLKKRVT